MTRNQFLYNHNNSKNSESLDYLQGSIIFKKSVSPGLYNNPRISVYLDKLSVLVGELIEAVKGIKRHYIITIDRDDQNID